MLMKRVFDLVFALLGLLLLAPLFLVIAVIIKLESKGPVFFRQERIGRFGNPFRIHKFRTMVFDAEKKGMQITVGSDSRITRVGGWLRKYKLDELAQLIDVVQGTMSLVGPRPEVAVYVDKYPVKVKDKVLSVRPGITDWASVLYKDESDVLASAEDPQRAYVEDILPIKLKYAVAYVDSRSFWVDLKIIFSTVKAVFF